MIPPLFSPRIAAVRFGCTKSCAFRKVFRRTLSQYPLPGALSYLSVPGKSPLLSLTVGQVLDATAEKFGDSDAILSVHQGIRRTYAQAKKESDDLAEGLLRLGLEKGDRVGIWSPNNHEWYLTHMAVAKAGLVLVSLNPALQAPELLYSINRVGVRALVISTPFKTQNYYDILASLVPQITTSDPGKIKSDAAPSLQTVITLEKKPLKGTYSFEETVHKGAAQKVEMALLPAMTPRIQFDDIFNIQFTSGTTGKPKGVMLSHHNVVNNSYLASKRLGLLNTDKVCCTVQLFHCYGSVIALLASVQQGAEIVLPAPSFDPVKSLQAVASEKCTVLVGTPTMHIDIMASPEFQTHDLSSIRIVTTGGASCPEDVSRQVAAKYSIPGISNFYGLTETSPLSFQGLVGESEEMCNTTVGYPLEHTEVKVVDAEDRIVPIGEAGEMCVRGYLTMLGYWDEPEKTSQVIKRDKWFHTGDSMVLLPNGYARVVGRLKDMIIRGGENIYPREIEEFLHTHPKIVEAHVFGVKDERLGEEVAAWVRLEDGQHMTEEDLRKFCKGQLSHFKIPKYISFRSDFPKTLSGKIQKSALREHQEKLLAAAEQKQASKFL